MWRKIERWLLPVSLALNLFFIVLALRHPAWRPHPPSASQIVDYMTSGLPPADAAILRDSFAEHAGALQEAHQTSADLPDKIRAALLATPFDPEVLRAALKAGQSSQHAMQDAMADALTEAATKMSPEGRAALASHSHFGPPGPPDGAGFHKQPPPN